MKIDYRRIESAESKIFRRIRLEALKNFPESFGTLYEEAETPQLYFEGIIERGDFANIFFFGAFADDGELLGIAGFARQTRAKSRHRGDIISMYVKPDFQGQKIGENLLHALTKKAFEIEDIEQIQLASSPIIASPFIFTKSTDLTLTVFKKISLSAGKNIGIYNLCS